MPKTRRSPTTIVLSRFFDDNVRLVAGVCSKCYLEEEEVKIVAVNRKFLKRVEARKNLKCAADSVHDGRFLDGDDASSQQTFDHCQGDRLNRLPTTTSTNDDDYALITDDARPSRQIKPRLNRNYGRKETAAGNSPDCAKSDENRDLGSEFFEAHEIKVEKLDNSDFHNMTLPKLTSLIVSEKLPPHAEEYCNKNYLKLGSDCYEDIKVKMEKPKVQNVNLAKLKFKEPPLSFPNSPESAKENSHPAAPTLLDLYHKTKTETPSHENRCIKTENPPKQRVSLEKLGTRFPLWSPPRSPHNLIEESLFRDPWSLLVATIFLNKTSCMCARPRVEEFLRDFSGPWEVLKRRPPELEKYFLDLGLHKKRAEQVWRMSHDYVHKNWRNAKELYGIGKYGEDAYRMFVLGDLDVEPTDRFLRIYRDWAKMKEKEEKMRCPEDD